MPMVIFVSCVEDLATLGSVRVVLDLSLSPPGPFSLFFVLSVMLWEEKSFHSGSSLAFWPHRVLEMR